MQTGLNEEELDMLKLRIAASAPDAQAALLMQLETLIDTLGLESQPSQEDLENDAEIVQLFENVPV